jgi:hypothetical protein
VTSQCLGDCNAMRDMLVQMTHNMLGRIARASDRRYAPVQTFLDGTKPMPTSTHTAHDVRPYTKTSGKYVIVLQQYLSTFLAQPRRRMVREGDDGGEGEANVAMVTGASRSRSCGASTERKTVGSGPRRRGVV